MTDVHNSATRSRNMAAIRGADTKPEILVRKALHSLGFRYRIHVRELPGKPDLVLPRYRAVIFVHGCFWHRHDCHLFKWPATRPEFWQQKLDRNVANDDRAQLVLRGIDWRVATVWECALRGRTKRNFDQAIQELAHWIRSEEKVLEIKGL
ncbi:very short patch repair endonuclease [Alteripontixanthobacter maritimus]|uniref:very short patch repair endonuclease n=1 Tax=Alteripontixanthobacter maritimus TaxID=2161824 RepID=UPI000E1B7F9F|nr:DNA mismatch endonuclease Vsr [Alteripontixanthobacter maritimus]